MKFIETNEAPLPAGHYSQAVVANGLVFVAGQLPISPGPERHIPDGIEAQAELAFRNVQKILQAAGSDLDRLVNVQLFIPDIDLWKSVNAIYERILGPHKPARTVIPCGPLHFGVLIEINAVAMVDPGNR